MTIPVGTTKASEVHYAEEQQVPKRLDGETLEFELTSAEVLLRDWDVNDPEARDAAAVLQLEDPSCPDDPHYALHAMWFINAKDNAAVLVVFRPKVAEHA